VGTTTLGNNMDYDIRSYGVMGYECSALKAVYKGHFHGLPVRYEEGDDYRIVRMVLPDDLGIRVPFPVPCAMSAADLGL